MDCKLILSSGGVAETFIIKEGVSTVGRESDSDIQVMSPSVSRHHAEIHNMSSVCELEDLDTPNGTYLNGERISVAKLSDGDEVRLGETRFRFVSGGASDSGDDSVQSYEYSDRAEMPTIMMKRPHHDDGEFDDYDYDDYDDGDGHDDGHDDGDVQPLQPLKPRS